MTEATASQFPADLVTRRTAEEIIAEALDSLPDLEPWQIARVFDEQAVAVQRSDLLYDPSTAAAVERAIRDLLGELREYCRCGPNPTPDAYNAACTALEKHRQRADQAEAERDRLAAEIARLTPATSDCICPGGLPNGWQHDFDPDCPRHGTPEPTDEDILALLPVAREATRWAVGAWWGQR